MVIQRAHWVQQQAMKESGALIRIDLDFKNAFNSAGHSCLWAILRGLEVPDVDFLQDLYSKSWIKITVSTGCSAPIQLDTGTLQGSVLSPLIFDLFLNTLLRLLDATGITHGIKRTPQWNHAAFADDLSIQVCVSNADKLLDVIHEFEFWSGFRISIPKSLASGAMYGTGTARRQEGAKIDATKRKRDAGPDILNNQIQALGARDDALDAENTAKPSIKGQEAWRINLATMYRQCPICNKKKGKCHFSTQLHLNPPCLECNHAWKPSGIKYNGTALKVIHGKTLIRLLGIRYNMPKGDTQWMESQSWRVSCVKTGTFRLKTVRD